MFGVGWFVAVTLERATLTVFKLDGSDCLIQRPTGMTIPAVAARVTKANTVKRRIRIVMFVLEENSHTGCRELFSYNQCDL